MMLLIDSLDQKKEFLEKHPYLIGVNVNEKFFPALAKNRGGSMTHALDIQYDSLIEQLKSSAKLSDKNRMYIKIILGDKLLNQTKLNGYTELKILREYIIKHKDIELLEIYMLRVARRQSVADIPVLGEFLQSDFYIKGPASVRHIILDQCALRKEKEVVWLLADSIVLPEPKEDRHKIDILLALKAKNRAKWIMVNFTFKDLGDDPKAWKKWYRDQ